MAMVGAAFEQQVAIAFIDDGVFQLKRGQNPAGVGLKNFTAAFGALGDHDIRDISWSANRWKRAGCAQRICCNWFLKMKMESAPKNLRCKLSAGTNSRKSSRARMSCSISDAACRQQIAV